MPFSWTCLPGLELHSPALPFFLLWLSCSVSEPVPLFPEPVDNRLPVYRQIQPAFIVRVILHPKNIILYVEVSPVLLGIDFTAASHSLFPDHKPFNHFFSEPQHGTELFHEKHFPEHREPSESPVYDSGEP